MWFDKLNPISVGHLGVTTLLACIALLPQMRFSVVRLAVVIAIGGAGLYVAVLGASRGPLVAMVAALGFLVCAKYGRWWVIAPIVLPVIWFVIEPLLSDAGVLEALRFSTILNALLSGDAGYDVTSSLRVEAFGEAWDRFASNPLFGSRFDLVNGGYPHNLWIESGMAMGIVGLVLLSGCLLVSLRRAWQLVQLDHWLLPLLFVQYAVGAMFSGAIWGSGPFWTIVAPLLVVGRGAARARPVALSSLSVFRRY
ncbi:MAG: O-antigen ligase family protein [Devosia sp.]|nr:O-antigen ligase family protein [Devosia sp.]